MQAFAYANPASVADAARAGAADNVKFLAGGQTLLSSMKLGLAAPDTLSTWGPSPTSRASPSPTAS